MTSSENIRWWDGPISSSPLNQTTAKVGSSHPIPRHPTNQTHGKGKKAYSLPLSSLSCNTLHWGSDSPLTDLELISWPLLLHFCQLQRQFGVCCSTDGCSKVHAYATYMYTRFTRERKSPWNSPSLGVLCCASSNFCRAS